MSSSVRRFLRLFPLFRKVEAERNQFKMERNELQVLLLPAKDSPPFFPVGHFYSPLPSRAEIAEAFARGGFGPPFPGVDLNEAGQFARLERFAAWYPDQPFAEEHTPGRRIYLDHP